MKRLSVLSILFVLLGPPFLARAADAPAPVSEEDAKAAFEKGDYPGTLKVLSKILAIRGKAAQGIDHYPLLMMRAESYIQLRQTSLALNSLEDAAKVAQTASDNKGAADARALIILIKRSKNLQYTPKVAVGEKKALVPIDISDLKKRKEALEALYSEDRAAARPLVMQADKAKNLIPIAKAMKVVVPLKDLELAASGADSETGETIKDLVDRSHKLMAKGLDDMSRRASKLEEKANQMEQRSVRRLDGSTDYVTERRGLMRDEASELKRTIQDCKKIVETCKELTANFTDETEPFDDLIDQAKDTGERAYDVLKDNSALGK